MQIAQHRCDVVKFPCVGNQTSSGILDTLQFPQYTVVYTSQKTVVVIQAAAMKVCTGVLTASVVSEHRTCRSCRS